MRDVDARYTLRTYGARYRFGPYHRQAVRWLGRALEQLGQRLDSWSWGWGR
jgi:hypothetical protein